MVTTMTRAQVVRQLLEIADESDGLIPRGILRVAARMLTEDADHQISSSRADSPSDLRSCVRCGRPIAMRGGRGRPRKHCEECLPKNRRKMNLAPMSDLREGDS